MAPKPAIHRSVNKWAARVIPMFLAGIVGYVTWVYIALLTVNYLIHPTRNVPPRTGAGIALIVLYFVLFFPMVVCYFRVIQVVATNPGHVPRPSRRHRRRASGQSSRVSQGRPSNSEKNEETHDLPYLDRTAVLGGRIPPPPGLKDFYSRDIFECDVDGLPRWCATCQNWKPDRSHHSSEVGRCVYKMDHFCPWAGGIVSETNFKFFIQFCTYTVLFCTLIVITTANFLSRGGTDELQKLAWIVMLALATLFMLFSAGMAINSLHFAFLNTTTVDNLSLTTRTHHFAVHVPELISPAVGYDTTPKFGTITYPLGPPAGGSSQRRTFAILATPVGYNPYRLPSVWENFQTVMGDRWYDWFLPFRYSPCCAHSANHLDSERAGDFGTSMYRITPSFAEIMAEAGVEKRLPPRD